MNNINKIFVITKNRSGWDDVQLVFDDYNLKMERYSIKKNKLPVSKLNSELCHPNVANQWYTHYELWKDIVKNNIRISLILEDGIFLIYCGCLGTCEMNSFIDELLSTVMDKNQNVLVNNKLNNNLIKPSFPIGTYGYLLSLKGAKKLINNKNMQTVNYRLDHSLANNILTDNTFQIYTSMPPLVYKDLSNNDKYIHQIIKYPTEKLHLSSQVTTYDALNYEPFYYRFLNIRITVFMLCIFITAFLLGYLGTVDAKQYFAIGLFVFTIIDILYAGAQNYRIKSYALTLLFAGLMIFLGHKLRY
jgi:hypothetical protein